MNLISSTVGGTFLPQSLPWGSSTQEMWGETLLVKTEVKTLLSTSAFSSSIITNLPVFLFRGGTLSLTFLYWLTELVIQYLFFIGNKQSSFSPSRICFASDGDW